MRRTCSSKGHKVIRSSTDPRLAVCGRWFCDWSRDLKLRDPLAYVQAEFRSALTDGRGA